MKKILIIDDHAVVRAGLEMMLGKFFPDPLIFEADSMIEAQNILATNTIDLVILDIRISGQDNFHVITTLRKVDPQLRIMVFTSCDEQKYALKYIQNGANGFVSKYATQEEIIRALRLIQNQDRYVSADVYQQMLGAVFNKEKKTAGSVGKSLSKREKEVANLLVEGKWTKEIAVLLNLKLPTVSTFKRRIFEKTGTSNVIELCKVINND
jgi:two-component system invasion response regulator UvrY